MEQEFDYQALEFFLSEEEIKIGDNRYYETMAFQAIKNNEYWEEEKICSKQTKTK